jgi:hypothetical protein
MVKWKQDGQGGGDRRAGEADRTDGGESGQEAGWITDLHRQARQSTPFTPAHTIAELTGRALTPLRSRGPSPAPRPRGANTSSPRA